MVWYRDNIDWISYAERFIEKEYGDRVSVWAAGKAEGKFGRTANADSDVPTTVAQFQGSVVNETYVSTNIIDSIVSSNAGDTQDIVVVGNTITAGGILTEVTQTATLTGQTEAALTTPLARANRAYVANSGAFDSPQAALAGNVAVYDNTDGITAGVPNTDAATKLMILAGQTQSQKCATAVPDGYYWLLSQAFFSVTGGGPASDVDFTIERRDIANGGAWRPLSIELTLSDSTLPTFAVYARPMGVIPPNHDVRVIGKASANDTPLTAVISGPFASVTMSYD